MLLPERLRDERLSDGATAGFVIILCTFYVWYRVRHKNSGGIFGFCMPKKKNESKYRQLESPAPFLDARGFDGSERKESIATSTTAPSTAYTTPPLRSAPMAPAPLRLNSTFIGRERNNLVRASLNRHQLSTLEEYSQYEYEDEPVRQPHPSQNNLARPSGETPRGQSPSSQSTASFESASEAPVPHLTSVYAVAPLQPRKINIRKSNPGKTAASQAEPSQVPPVPPEPSRPGDQDPSRLRPIDHWADYQNKMAERDRSMTSGEYGEAFKDRESVAASAADSAADRDSRSTIAAFKHHPGEEVQVGPSLGERDESPASPSHQTNNNQTYPPPKRMHSAAGSKRSGPRYQYPPQSSEPQPPQPPSNTPSSTTPPSSSSADNVPQSRHESDQTVFKYHPGREVVIDRTSKIKSEDLDAYFYRPPSSGR